MNQALKNTEFEGFVHTSTWIKPSKTTNFKGLATLEHESSPQKHRIWRVWPHFNMNQALRNNEFEAFVHTWTWIKPSSTLCPYLAPPESHLFWPPDGCYSGTPICGRLRRADTQRALKAPILQRSFTRETNIVSRKGGKNVLNEGDFVETISNV